ncbi:MAG TPA: hypothetical protein VKV17_18455 [Bryobacteraceae bacterium]|nr:hypothetical protein [Bryobacteraceae bacterium]
MRAALLLLLCEFGTLAFADVITLKDGRQISGTIETGNTQEIRIQAGGSSQAIAVSGIQSIKFGVSETAPPPPAAAVSKPAPPPVAVAQQTPPPRPATRPAAPATPSKEPADSQTVTLPIGTEIAVRTIDRIESKKADLSREYQGSLDDPIVVNGVEVVPANTSAVLKIVEAQGAGLTHRASLSTALVAVIVRGQRYNVVTGKVDSKAGSPAKRTVVGGAAGAGAGAAIGAAAGGAAGAAVGAGVGAAAGAITGKLTGKGVEIAPETRFTYTLTQPAVIAPEESAR